MNMLLTIPWATTDWSSEGRLTSSTTLPVNEAGRAQASQWRKAMHDCAASAIYVSKEVTSNQTAEVLVDGNLSIKIKQCPDLHEISVGLWEGLSADALQSRFAKAYKRWRDDPASVCPPEGEPIGQAQDRLMAAIGRIAPKTDGRRAVVLGPLACGVVRCSLESLPLEQAHELSTPEPIWYTVQRENDLVVGNRMTEVASRG